MEANDFQCFMVKTLVVAKDVNYGSHLFSGWNGWK